MIFLDKSPLATAIVTSAILRTCRREIGGHGIDVVGQILPRSRDAGHDGLSTQFAFGAHFASDASHFGGEGAQLIDHLIDGLFELENFPAHVHGDLLGQVTVGHGNRDIGDIADLRL